MKIESNVTFETVNAVKLKIIIEIRLKNSF